MSFRQYRSALIQGHQQLLELSKDPTRFRECFNLQKKLLSQILKVERRARQHKAKEKELRRSLRSRGQVLTRVTADAVRKQIARCASERDDLKHVLYALRTIGDGIAFTYFDRFDLKPMVLKEAAGYLSGKAGIALERAVLQKIFDMGGVGVMNDLTTCLRHGDLTLLTASGQPALLELKSGTSARARDRRQAQRLTELVNYLSMDVTKVIFGNDKEVRRVAAWGEITDHSEGITALVQRRSKGLVRLMVEPGLAYVVADVKTDPAEVVRAMTQGLGERPLVFFVNEMKWEAAGYFPFTLTMCDPEGLFAFYCGDIVVFVILDLGVFKSRIGEAGLTAAFENEGEYMVSLRRVGTSVKGAKVSRHLFTRLASEFITLDWLVKECVWVYQRTAEAASIA
jgi:hypothetical protein